ncbi:hypothetical protein CSOJ01_11188 [Colletotrichum sojae]|uniref:Uncharacterized protein n=1 Tax=Colletotrichum sojae TaxID=2175907 RepID=A0A8H6IY44_9PEZI|nr:hypothetical protein CSOJ01_11188 [Colletotrichum sojae]
MIPITSRSPLTPHRARFRARQRGRSCST